MKKSLILAGASLFALIQCPVYAQDAPQNSSSAEEENSGIAEIIVTAQKRPELAQKAPLAVTSLNADTLAAAQVSGATDLQRVVPNLTAQVGGGAGDPGGVTTLFSIRGLGASTSGVQGSAGVAAHFDGIYVQPGISNSEFFDLERIEVSPGPQGTLYGRSAAAGAVNVIPAKPTNKTEVAGSVQYGNYDALTTQAMVNIALSDQIAVRAAFQTQNHDGYYANGYDNLDSFSGRLQVLIKPDDRLSVRLSGTFTQVRGLGAGNSFIDGPAFPLLTAVVPRAGNPDLRAASISELCLVRGQLLNTCVQDVRIDRRSLSAEIIYDFGGAVLTVVPSYAKTKRQTRFANAPLPLSYYDQSPYDNTQTTFEARLSDSGSSDLKWVVGGNFYKNKVDTFVDQFINVLLPPGTIPPLTPFGILVSATNAFQDQQSVQKSYAVFGQATYPIADTIRLTLGGRYNHDKSGTSQLLGTNSNVIYQFNGQGPFLGTPLFTIVGAPVITPRQTGSRSFNAFTYRAAIDVDVGPASILYASIGSGYKPGGLNDGGPISSTMPASPFAPEQFFGPERVTHFEFGSKNRFFGNRLQINNTMYYDDYSDYQNGQTQVVNPLQFGALGFVITNAGKARVFGDELSIKWQPTQNDEFEVSANYLNAEFTSYLAPAYLAPNGPSPALDISGFNLPNAPEFSGNFSYRHTFDLGGSGRLIASVFSHLTDGYYVYFAQAPGTYQKSYTSTTLNLTWMSANDRFKLSAFVSNLENDDIKVSGGTTAGYSQIGLAPPRTYGGLFAFKF